MNLVKINESIFNLDHLITAVWIEENNVLALVMGGIDGELNPIQVPGVCGQALRDYLFFASHYVYPDSSQIVLEDTNNGEDF